LNKLNVASKQSDEFEYDGRDFLLFYNKEDAINFIDQFNDYRMRDDISENILSIYDVLTEFNVCDKESKEEFINKYVGKYVFYRMKLKDGIKLGIGTIVEVILRKEPTMICSTGVGRCYCDEKNIDDPICPHLIEDDDYDECNKDYDVITVGDLNSGGCLDFMSQNCENVIINKDNSNDDSSILNSRSNRKAIDKIENAIDYIYFIQEPITKSIKIGTTKNIKNRMSQLQTSIPFQLILLKFIKGDFIKEKELHDKFSQYRLSGEWFSENDELLDYIAKIK
jgi:hypothetical protein